jgi:tryptophan 2,3-dioxygenase
MTGNSSEYRKLTDAERSATAEKTGGEPVYDLRGDTGDDTTTYIEYVRTDLLHSLQRVRSKEPDEMTFLAIGQVMELLFGLAHSEIKRGRESIHRDDVAAANVILARVQRILELLAQSWEVICTLTPTGYLGFRDHLGRASGFGSHMYRHLEFVLGNKMERMLKLHEPTAEIHAALKADFDAPSLYDEVICLLQRRGFPIDAACLNRDWS